MNKEIDDMVVNWINEIDGIYPAMNPIEDDGYAISFPLNSTIEIQNQWLSTTVEEIYLIIPEKNPAFFIVFDEENSPVLFLFPGKIDELSDILNFQLK